MDQDAVNLFKQRLQTMALTPSTGAVFCDLRNASQAEAQRRRIIFAEQLGARYVISEASGETREERRKVINSLCWMGDYYAADRGIGIAFGEARGSDAKRKARPEVPGRVGSS